MNEVLLATTLVIYIYLAFEKFLCRNLSDATSLVNPQLYRLSYPVDLYHLDFTS